MNQSTALQASHVLFVLQALLVVQAFLALIVQQVCLFIAGKKTFL